MPIYINRKRKKNSNKIYIFFIILFVSFSTWVFTSEIFEREFPSINTFNQKYWNIEEPFKINISDNLAIKEYKVSILDKNNKVTLLQEVLSENIKSKTIKLIFPTNPSYEVKINPKSKNIKVAIEIRDKSSWNFFTGNSIKKVIDVKLDNINPKINILSHSYSITQGGAALVIFKATDENGIGEIYIQANKNRFKVQKYKKQGYYVALIAWSFVDSKFISKIIVKDKAGNTQSMPIPFFLKKKRYKTSWIKAKDSFIDNKIPTLLPLKYFKMNKDRFEIFRIVNEKLREKNERLIHSFRFKPSLDYFQKWSIKKFHPLRRAARVATFGDKRYYFYKTKGEAISTSYHLGLDLASIKNASIISSNTGKVIFVDYNGIYGHMPIISHGLGLQSLYGHCSEILVKKGDDIFEKTIIAKTGMSGLALGDHLHFGILVQGVEVRPKEWMDSKWIKDNIYKMFREAEKKIK